MVTLEKNPPNIEEHLWRRIKGGSILICDSIRSCANINLQKKFDDLLSKSQSPALIRPKATVQEHPKSQTRVENVPTNSMVTVIGGITISDSTRSLLELGPSFSPSQPISRVTLRKKACGLHELQDKLRFKARQTKNNTNEEQIVGKVAPQTFP